MLISNEFVASEACQRMFQFAKDSLQKDIQLCMIGEGREWMQSDFIGYQVTEQVETCVSHNNDESSTSWYF